MHRFLAAFAPLILLSAAWAVDDPKDKAAPEPPAKPESVADRVNDLQKEMLKTRAEILAKLRKAETNEEKQDLIKEYTGLGQKYAKKYLALAEQNLKDPGASKALAMVLTTGAYSPEANKALDLIVKNDLYDSAIISALPMLTRMGGPNAEKLLRGAAEHAKTNDDRGKATMALAKFLKTKAERAHGGDAKKLNAEAEKLFETVAEKYADVKVYNRPLGPQAKGELFEMRHLAIGKTAPEIEAEDLDSVKFKLSDYRGKVVLLDFWGNW